LYFARPIQNVIMDYLSFEKPIEELEIQLSKALELADETGVDMAKSIDDIRQKLDEAKKKIYGNLSAWERVQLSRHPQRPYTQAYINAITERQYRNFGMANPEGYRKALRLMKQAEKFGRPIITLIDTPGAFPGLEAEERGQGEAIAKNIMEMSRLKVPVICIIIGEGASGGAIGIGVGDKVLMLENTWYSVISPESCSSILWRTWDYKETAADALKLTAKDMKKNGLIDGIIKEPLGGAHANPDAMFEIVKREITKHTKALLKMDPQERVEARMEKFFSMGVFAE